MCITTTCDFTLIQNFRPAEVYEMFTWKLAKSCYCSIYNNDGEWPYLGGSWGVNSMVDNFQLCSWSLKSGCKYNVVDWRIIEEFRPPIISIPSLYKAAQWECRPSGIENLDTCYNTKIGNFIVKILQSFHSTIILPYCILLYIVTRSEPLFRDGRLYLGLSLYVIPRIYNCEIPTPLLLYCTTTV